ncbi:MAG: hypothetical protein L0215_22460 [Gemmataceae bacterium]|nr:hypothetical protein [Gemmataceae bacterium]
MPWKRLFSVALLGAAASVVLLALAGFVFGMTRSGAEPGTAARLAWIVPLFLSPCAFAAGFLCALIYAIAKRGSIQLITVLAVLVFFFFGISIGQAASFHRYFIRGEVCYHLK